MNKVLQFILLLGVALSPSCCLFNKLPELPKYGQVIVDGKKQFLPKSLLNELPDFKIKKDVQKPAEEKPTVKLEKDLEETFSWLAKISAVLAVLLWALGFINPLLGKLGLGKWLGLVSVCSIGALYFIPYFPYIFGTAAFVLFLYLLWKLYRVVKEKIELEKLTEDLAELDRDESQRLIKSMAPRTTVKIKE